MEIPEKFLESYRNISVTTIEGLAKSTKTENINVPTQIELPIGFKALFQKPYLNLSIKVYILYFCILMGYVSFKSNF